MIKRRSDHKSLFMNVDYDDQEIENLCKKQFKIKKNSKVKVSTILMLERMRKF
jgi:hypothetical protein